MNKEIELNGEKYRLVENEECEAKNIKGQGFAIFGVVSFGILTLVSVVLEEWISMVICFILIFVCGGLGIDALDDIKKRIWDLK